MNRFNEIDFSQYDLNPREPIVTSSFYASPNGKRSVRAYEIVNSNTNIRKIKKNELDEPRFENSMSKAFKQFKSLFVSDNPRSRAAKISDYGVKSGVNVKKGVSFHTKNDGGLVAVTSLDLQNQKGDNAKLKEFVQRKAMADKVNNTRQGYTTANRPVTVLMQQPQNVLMHPPQTVFQQQANFISQPPPQTVYAQQSVPIYQNSMRTINEQYY